MYNNDNNNTETECGHKIVQKILKQKKNKTNCILNCMKIMHFMYRKSK